MGVTLMLRTDQLPPVTGPRFGKSRFFHHASFSRVRPLV